MTSIVQDDSQRNTEKSSSLNETNKTAEKETWEKGWTFRDRKPFSIKDDFLSLRHKREWCDTLIKVGESTTYAHKAILSSECQMFKGMFQSSCLETIRNQIDLSRMFGDINMAELFIDYLYVGKIVLSDTNIEAIFEAAHMTLMENLQNHCLQFLLHRLSVANVISTMRLAERYDATQLIDVCDSLLQKTEDVLYLNPEIPTMESENFLSFLNTEVISNYKMSVKSALVLSWLSVDVRKRSPCVQDWLWKIPINKSIIDDLIVDPRKKRDLVLWLKEQKLSNQVPASVMDETSTGHLPLLGNWTVVVQSNYGKTGFYCPELRKWFILDLRTIDGEILGLLDGGYLIYLHSDINAVTCVQLPSGNLRQTSIPDSCGEHAYQNCDVDSACPYHYFCRNGILYGINPITKQNLKIEGWGVYRFYPEEIQGWTLLGDVFFQRDFYQDVDRESEVKMLPIYDPDGYAPDEPVVYICLQDIVNTGNLSITFLYNHQVREYNSFTACKYSNSFLDILVLTEVLFVARFNTVAGLCDLPAEVNFTVEDSSCQIDLYYQNGNSSLKSSSSISLTIPKPSHFPLRYAWTESAESTITGKKTTPLCPFPKSKQAVLFDGNLYVPAHLSPLDYHVMIYDLNNYPKGNLPPLPFPSHDEMRMTPLRTTKPISSVIKNRLPQRYINGKLFREKIFKDWVFSFWKGQYQVKPVPFTKREYSDTE